MTQDTDSKGGWTVERYGDGLPPQETEADRLARCAPQLVEALKRIEHGKLIHADDGSMVLVEWSPGEASEIAHQALSEAGIEL